MVARVMSCAAVAARCDVQGRRQPFPDRRDSGAELGSAGDPERDRDRGQPLPGIHGRIAGGAGQDASRTVVDGAEMTHRRPDMPGGLSAGNIEHDPGLELPAGPQVLLQQVRVVEVGRGAELLAARGDGLNPVNAVGAGGAGAVRVAQQVPAAVPHDDGPRVNVLGPSPARLASVADAHLTLGRDGGNQSARRLHARPRRPAVGHGAGMPAHGSGLMADVLRQGPDDLAERGADRIVGIRGGVAAVEHGHDQAEGLGGAEQQRRAPGGAAEPVAAEGSGGRLHGDLGLAQDRDVAARGAFGHAQLGRHLGGGDAGLRLQQLEGPERPRGGAQVGFHPSRLIRKLIVRNRAYPPGMEILLIAGLWLDGSVWDSTAAQLEARGHRGIPVALPGQGDGSTSATLADQVAAVVAAVDAAAGRPLVAGHSAACNLAWLAADARPAKISQVALIGGFPSCDGEAHADIFPTRDGAMPFPGWDEFEGPDSADLDDAAKQAIASAAIPVPEGVTRGVIRLADERRYDVPVALVCPEFTPAQAREWVEQGEVPELAKARTVSFIDIGSGHWPMVSVPAELARVLSQAAESQPYTIEPLGSSTWAVFAELVERNNGVFGGCWCMGYHPDDSRDAARNRAAKEHRVRAGRAHAALVVDQDGSAQGWCQYGSPEELSRIKHR